MALTISARSRAEICTTWQLAGRSALASGSTNNTRAATAPVICKLWRVMAGSQTPRLGGTTQLPCSVSTRTTPLKV